MKITLGDEVKDMVSGFTGIAIGRTTYLNGCDRIGIQPPILKDGKHPDALWFDEPQIKIIKVGKVKVSLTKTGGPVMSMPSRTSLNR